MIVCGPRYRAVAGVGAVGGVVPFVFSKDAEAASERPMAAVRGVRVPKTDDDVGFGRLGDFSVRGVGSRSGLDGEVFDGYDLRVGA